MTRDTTLKQAAGGRAFSQAADFLRRIELERADAARKALEDAAQRVETQDGNDTYQKAFKASAALLRKLKADL